MKKLPLLCASNEGGYDEQDQPLGFHTTPCTGKKCTWFEKGACSAGTKLSDEYRRWFKPDSEIPPCPIAERCTWNVEAVARNEPACGVRRLGMICEHQGGEWNTWQMAEASDVEAWGPRPDDMNPQ